MWCPNSPAVTWTHILLIVLHRASHKGNDSHLVILALPVLQGQLQKEEGVLESATGIPQFFPITLFLTASIYCEPTITLAPDLNPSPSLPFYLCLCLIYSPSLTPPIHTTTYILKKRENEESSFLGSE